MGRGVIGEEMAKVASRLAAERDRWALWLPVLFGTGIGFYFALSFEPPLWIGLAGLAAATGVAVIVKRRRPDESGLLFAGIVAVGMLAAGFTAAQWRTQSVAAPVLDQRIGPTTVTGRIAYVESYLKDSRLTLEKVRIGGVVPDLTPENIRLRVRGNQPSFSPGQWVRVRAIMSPPPPPAAPGAFDFQRQSYFQRLGAVGFSIGTAEILAGAEGSGMDIMILGLARLRQAVTQRILDALPGQNGAIAAALMTGERSAIPDDVMNAMRDSGLAHLLAISGLNIGLVAGILFVGFRTAMALVPPLALYHPIKKIAAAIAVVGAFAYTAISGATVPTQRAFMMAGVMLLAVMVDRRGLSVRLVAWAAFAILLVQPESLLGASFQMSFAAVVALIAAYEALSGRRDYRDGKGRWLPPWLRKAGLYVSAVALTTLVAGTATAPFAIYHFNRFAEYGLAANMAAVPLTSLWVMPWAVVAFLLMPFGLESLGLIPMGRGVGLVIEVAEIVSSWPGAVTLLPSMPTASLVAITLGGLWLCLWWRRWRFYGVAIIAVGVMAFTFVRPPDMLVDGQGRLLAVRTEEGTMAVSNLKRNRFDREIWLRRAGQDEAVEIWPTSGTSADGLLTCDVEGCLYRLAGHVVAIAYEDSALGEDCWVADVVVAVVPVRQRCPASAVIDRFDLWREGAHALWVDKGAVRIESVNAVRGHRPWVLKPSAGRR
jgi:competence protein ComEC